MSNRHKALRLLCMALALLLLTGCPDEGENYVAAEEQYAMGWILHNIDENTPVNLEYSREEIALYNYSFGFPATSPLWYDNYFFWMPPKHKNSIEESPLISTRIRFTAPLARAYYIQGENPVKDNYNRDWAFKNFMNIEYSNKPEAFNFEIYPSLENMEIVPVPGAKRNVYFGKAPYTPASYLVQDKAVKLNGNLLRGYDNNSFVQKFGSDFPSYQIFYNDVLQEEGELIDFNFSMLSYQIKDEGSYRIELTVPTDYPVWNIVKVDGLIKVPNTELQPPELQHIEANPYFIAGEEYNILVDLYDESGIEKVEISILGGDAGLSLPIEAAEPENGIYKASFKPSEGTEKIELSVTATDIHGNSVTYIIMPVALPAESITFNLEAEDTIASIGQNVKIQGQCKILNEACNTFLMRYYINNEFFKTGATSKWDGSFELNWEIPLEYDADEINFTVKYDGTGIYLPHQEKITIPVKESLETDVGIFDLETTKPALGEPVIVSATLKNLGFKDASDVLVKFKVGGKILDEVLIPSIEAKKAVTVEFEWQPVRESSYEIKLEAIAENDEDSSNNFLEKEIEIGYIAPDITGFIEEPGKVIINLESDISFSIFNNGEEEAKDLDATFYAFYKPERTYLFFPGEEEESKEEKSIETPEAPAEEPIEEPAEPEEKKEKEKPSEPGEGKPSEPGTPGGGGGGGGGSGGGSTKPEEKPVSISSADYNGTIYNFLASSEGFDLELNVSTEAFNKTLSFDYNERIRKLQGDIYIFADFFSESTIMLTIGNASLIKKDIADLDASEQRTEAIKWAPTLKGEHFLMVFVNTSKDSNFETNYFGTYVKVLREGINIRAELMIGYEKTFVVGNETNITARITNLGTEEAKNLHIVLLEQKKEDETGGIIPKIKNKEIGSKKLDSLGAGKNEELKFSWTPSKPGDNFLLLIAEAKKDINPEDNDDFAFVDVSAKGSDIAASFEYPKQDIFVNEKVKLNARLFNRGLSNSTNVSASLYEIGLKGKKESARKLLEKRSLGIIEPDKFIDVEFNWTPSSSGDFFLELISESENDENNENNADSIHISALTKGYDAKPTIFAYPRYIMAEKTVSVEILLENFGSESAPEFNLTLYANGNYADSNIYDGLEPQETSLNSLSWTPSAAGAYELKVNISLADGDSSNNADISEVVVFNAKDVKISFVDEEGKFVGRTLVLGQEGMEFEGIASFTIPDTALDMWIAKENEPVLASIYSNSTVNNMTLASSYINEPVMQNGLLLYNIFANNDSWDYESFSGILMSKLETLNIRYTELKAFLCDNYNFSSGKCGNWKDTPSEVNVGSGELLLTMEAKKAAAFAIGDKDYDNDNAPDWDDSDSDNDGIDDEEDSFTCLNGRLGTRKEFNITVNESEDTGKELKGKNKVGIKDKNKKIVEFGANFDKDRLDCREISVEKQPEVTTRGYTLIKGISLSNETKTAYVDKIAAFKRVCIKDAEIESIDEVTQNCNGNDEILIMCNGSSTNGYTCTDIGAQYKVEGLKHSAVVEPSSCQESWSCTSWSECDDEEQERVCKDSNSCGTNFNKPSEERSCKEDEKDKEDKGKDEGKGLSGSLSRSTFDLGEIKEWAAGKSRSLKVEANDLITFNFGNRLQSIKVASQKEASIVIEISWAKKGVELRKGQAVNFDIDKDGKDDISVSFTQSSLNRLTLTIERIKSDSAKLDVQKKADASSQLKEDAKDAEKEEKKDEGAKAKEKKGGLLKGIIYSLISLTLVVVVGLIAYNRLAPSYRDRSLERKEEPSSKQSDYYRLSAYIRTQLQRGASYEQISQSLQNVGWKKELIEFVIGEIKGKR